MEKETKLVKKKKGPAPVLTEQQIKFAELLIYEAGRKSPAECAFEAGYRTRPRQSASELRNPSISFGCCLHKRTKTRGAREVWSQLPKSFARNGKTS